MNQSTSPTNFTNKATMNHPHPPTVLLGMFQSDVVFRSTGPRLGSWAEKARKAFGEALLKWGGRMVI